jgi:hypothetical protein
MRECRVEMDYDRLVDTLGWLLNSDPAIRWQTLRDLTDASAADVSRERARLAHEGLAAEILACQCPDGAWRQQNAPAWRTTLFTMQLLRATGIDPLHPSVMEAVTRLEAGVRWNDQDCGWELRAPETGGNTFFQGEVEPCINGGALAAGSYFGRADATLAQRLVSEQLEDGGWNCEAPPSTRSSFHTTICVLEGLLEFERVVGQAAEVTAARRRGEEYLLKRSLHRRLTTGTTACAAFLEFAFPPTYRYDVLRALDYFRAAGAEKDARLAEAIDIVKSKQQPDGRWLLDAKYDKVIPVPMTETVNQPSQWNTLRALRVLRWAEGLGL